MLLIMFTIASCSFRGNQRPNHIVALLSEPSLRLHLHLLETVLPEGHVGSDTILAVVEEDDPMSHVSADLRNSLDVVSREGKSATYIPSGSMDSPMRNS